MKFKKGDRVCFSVRYYQTFRRRRKNTSTFGTVVGYSRNGENVRVLKDGTKTVENWSPDFWELVNDGNTNHPVTSEGAAGERST